MWSLGFDILWRTANAFLLCWVVPRHRYCPAHSHISLNVPILHWIRPSMDPLAFSLLARTLEWDSFLLEEGFSSLLGRHSCTSDYLVIDERLACFIPRSFMLIPKVFAAIIQCTEGDCALLFWAAEPLYLGLCIRAQCN